MPSIYNDRKMLKWLPFEALEAQGDYLNELYRHLEKEQKPTLSDDQYASMQYSLEIALREGSDVKVTVFEQSKRHQFVDQIVGVDQTQGLIFFKSHAVFSADIIDLATI